MQRGLRPPSIMLPALRRWFTRHPARWVLGLALGLALSGAQVVAACHEWSHLLARAGTDTGVPLLASAGDQAQPAAATGGHECAICLIAAAFGGVATAPSGPVLATANDPATTTDAVARVFVPRFAPAYASRAPPLASSAA
jgi:hypothetical protein